MENYLKRFKEHQYGRKFVKPTFVKGKISPKVKGICIKMAEIKANVFQMSLKVIMEDVYYLDSGFSKH
jgi:hypothetical protein